MQSIWHSSINQSQVQGLNSLPRANLHDEPTTSVPALALPQQTLLEAAAILAQRLPFEALLTLANNLDPVVSRQALAWLESIDTLVKLHDNTDNTEINAIQPGDVLSLQHPIDVRAASAVTQPLSAVAPASIEATTNLPCRGFRPLVV
jgi:hypothetical protein